MTRWSVERAADWQQSAGWLLGCNFAPSTAGNQLELWQEASFDASTIDRELGWAGELGMNVVRVYLHDLVYQADGDRYLDRIDAFLTIAANHGIGAVPVLFDGVWHPRPKLGPQPDPTPGRHNAIWVQGPGSEVLYSPERWDELEPYVTATLRRFADDARIVAWDLFNEPDQMDRDTLRIGSRDAKAEAATGLLDRVFDWARAVAPSQPLTVGLWEYDDERRPLDNAINSLILRRSDVISFHCYEPLEQLSAVIDALQAHGRPLLCTEWLARSAGSTADLLPAFAARGVGAINWGLVDGRTQTRFPWTSWTEPTPDDAPWFHELLHDDGTPYDQAEADLFRETAASMRAG